MNEMKVKRRKTGDGGAKTNEKGNILERQELVVQRLSSEVSGKAQKYTREGPCEFVQYDEEEPSIEGIKAACEKHFSPSLERKGLSCDVLAGEQGPSCQSMKHIPDLKVIHVRFIKSSSTLDSGPIANDYESSSSRQQCFSEPVTPSQFGVLDDLINRTWITFKSGMCFNEWQDGPCSPTKTSQDNPLRSSEGEKCF